MQPTLDSRVVKDVSDDIEKHSFESVTGGSATHTAMTFDTLVVCHFFLELIDNNPKLFQGRSKRLWPHLFQSLSTQLQPSSDAGLLPALKNTINPGPDPELAKKCLEIVTKVAGNIPDRHKLFGSDLESVLSRLQPT